MNPQTSIHRFPGGLRLAAKKAPQTAQAVLVMPCPAQLVIPLTQHIGLPARPVVSVGDRVLRGQLIGVADGPISANVHASTSGVVTAIDQHCVAHASGLSDLCVFIDADGEDRAVDMQTRDHDYHLDDPNQLRLEVAQAGVVGLGGAVFPSAVKLAAEVETRLHTLVLNGAECEPYISCDDMLMRERAGGIVRGAQCMLHILQIHRCLIAVENDKSEALAALQAALDTLGDDRLSLIAVPAIYPQGGERQLIQTLSGKEVPSDGLPPDIGYLCHNVATAFAVERAVVHGEPLISRIVSVCGSAVSAPRNVEVRLGTRAAEVIALCGGYTGTPRRLIMGGEMMGVALSDDATPIVKAFNCLLVLGEDDPRPLPAPLPCIRCGECAEVCPAQLLPQQLHWYTQARDFARTVELHLFDCIDCGCCDLVCPSHIPLSEQFRFAKSEVHVLERERLRAGHAKRRYEQRNARLAADRQRRRKRARPVAPDAAQGSDGAQIADAAQTTEAVPLPQAHAVAPASAAGTAGVASAADEDAQRRAEIEDAVRRAKARRAARNQAKDQKTRDEHEV